MNIENNIDINNVSKNLDFFNLEDIDLIVKFLYVKAKVENNNYDFYKKLYEKAILRFFGGVNDGKNKISDFIESFDRLIDSIDKNGFDDKSPIILSPNDMILNGRHRLAICKYFGIKPVFDVIQDIGHKRFITDLEFYKSVYSDFEIETIIVDFLNNFKTEDYFLTFLWGDSENKWNNIEDTFIDSNCSLVYKKIYNFNDKQYFENILEGLYTYENGIVQNGNIFIKTEGLKNNMRFKLLMFKFDKQKTYRSIKKGFPICVEIENIKFSIRKKLSSYSNEKNYSFLHTSDNYDHTRYLSNFIFNENLHFFKKISRHNKYINRTNKLLIKFDNFIKKNNLDRYDYCFESGIILQIFGIRKASDLDFICLKKIRSSIKDLPKDIDLHDENRFFHISKLTDNDIVQNRDNYFMYKGFKFISPNLLIENTSHLSKKKNLDMRELQSLINRNKRYKLNIFYKFKVAYLLKYYWFRRRIIDFLTFIFSKRQKYYIKKFLNKYFGQNYNVDENLKI